MNNSIEWVYWPDPRAVTKGKVNLSTYNQEYSTRKQKYPDYVPSQIGADIALEIEEKGYAKIENILDTTQIDVVSKRVEEILNIHNHPANQSKVKQTDARKKVPYIQVLQPFYNVPEILPFVFNKLIVDIAGAYLGCMPSLSTCNLRKSFVNDLAETGTQIYHVDPNSPRFLKFFIYLNDVDLNGGPFSFVEGSHKKKFEFNGRNWNEYYSWDLQTINNLYGEENVKYLTAKKGDLLVADTNGWHRGTKPLTSDRTMLTLDYACHPEFFNIEQTFLFRETEYEKLDVSLKPLCDFLKIEK